MKYQVDIFVNGTTSEKCKLPPHLAVQFSRVKVVATKEHDITDEVLTKTNEMAATHIYPCLLDAV